MDNLSRGVSPVKWPKKLVNGVQGGLGSGMLKSFVFVANDEMCYVVIKRQENLMFMFCR